MGCGVGIQESRLQQERIQIKPITDSSFFFLTEDLERAAHAVQWELYYSWTPAGLSTKASLAGVLTSWAQVGADKVESQRLRPEGHIFAQGPQHAVLSCPLVNSVLLGTRGLVFFLVPSALQLELDLILKGHAQSLFSWGRDRRCCFSLYETFWLRPCNLIFYAFTMVFLSRPWPILIVLRLV